MTIKTSESNRPIVVIWSRFGPYHVARVRGCAEVAGARGIPVVGLEVASTDQTYDWASVSPGRETEIRTLFPSSKYEEIRAPQIWSAVFAILNQIKPIAVACNGWQTTESRSALLWSRLMGITCIVMSETKSDDQSRSNWKESLKGCIVRQFDAAVVGGRKQQEYLRSLGFRQDRIWTGYDAVDNNYFFHGAATTRSQAKEIRRRLGLPEKFFFACTRFLERKNVDGLLTAYARYRSAVQGSHWGLVIAGSGSQQERLRKLQLELGIENVRWPGFLQYQDLPTYYGLASAFIHPAKAEAWGLVVNEAAASQLPILAGRTVGAAAELVCDGRNGYTFDADDPESISDAMMQLTQHTEADLLRMGELSSQLVGRFSVEAFGEGILNAVNSIRDQKKLGA